MTLLQRSRVFLATLLLRHTSCAVVRLQPLVSLNNVAVRLRQYVEHSGGLQDPRRIRAYRMVLRAATDLSTSASALLVDTKRVHVTPAGSPTPEGIDAARQSQGQATA